MWEGTIEASGSDGLVLAGRQLGIQVLDHIIVAAGGKARSFAESSLMPSVA